MIVDLYTKLGPELHRYILKAARDASEADDVLQDTFLRALSNMNVLQKLNRQQQRAWLYTTARRCLIDRRRRERHECLTDSITENETNDDLSVLFVAEAIDSLPENLQKIISMRYLAGMNSTVIGNILGIPPATVRTRLRAGVILLRKWVSK